MKRHDEIEDRLVKMVCCTNLVALDKTINAIRYSKDFRTAATRVADIASRITRAAFEVKRCFPK